MKIVFATNNAHKLEEVQQILGDDFDLITLSDAGITEDIPEDEPTLEGNALAKARYVYSRTGLDCFADDTGLEVEALGGQPGVFSARYAGTGHDSAANMAKLMEQMDGVDNRNARFRTVVALIVGRKEHLFEGEVKGEIVRSACGVGGFGYDPVFLPKGYDVTFAQMAAADKNAISHRGRAVAKLVQYIKTL